MAFLVVLFAMSCVVCASTAIADCVPGLANCQDQDAYATNMLQVDLSRKKAVDRKSSSHIHPDMSGPRAKPGAWCCDLYIGRNKLVSPRTVLQDSFAFEMITVFPITGTQIVVNETHVFFPSKDKLRGTFVRNTHVLGHYEYGTTESKFYENPLSMFPDVVGGTIEKLRVLHREGHYSSASLDRVNEIKKERWSITNTIAQSMNKLRIVLLNYVLDAGKYKDQLALASLDLNHLDRVKEFTRANNGQPTAFLQERKNQLVQNMSRQKSLAGKETLTVFQGCQHFGKAPGVQASIDGIYLPLNKKIVGLGGHGSFSPLQYMDLASGVIVTSYDESTKEVRIHYSASSLSTLTEPEETSAKADFYLGPPNGQSFDNGVVPEEGRAQPIVPDTKASALWDLVVTRIPVDFTYIYQDEEVACPPERLEELKEEAKNLDFRDHTKFTLFDFATHMVDVSECGLSYLQGFPANSHGMGFFELGAWGHLLLESPAAHRLDNARGWDPVTSSLARLKKQLARPIFPAT